MPPIIYLGVAHLFIMGATHHYTYSTPPHHRGVTYDGVVYTPLNLGFGGVYWLNLNFRGEGYLFPPLNSHLVGRMCGTHTFINQIT